MAVSSQPGLLNVRFEVDSDAGLADIPETADAELGLMENLSPGKSVSSGSHNGHHNGVHQSGSAFHKHLDLARTPSGSSMDTALNSPQGSSASTATGAASTNGSYTMPSSSARAARRLKIEEIFLQFTCDDREDRTLSVAYLGTVIRYLGHRLTEVTLQKVIQEADADGGGSLDIEEFVAMAEQLDASAERERMLKAATSSPARLFSSPAKSAREREFRRVFVACMQPESTTIAVKDLGVVIRLLGYVLTEAELQKVSAEADEDGGGTLDFEEFLIMAERLDEVYARR